MPKKFDPATNAATSQAKWCDARINAAALEFGSHGYVSPARAGMTRLGYNADRVRAVALG